DNASTDDTLEILKKYADDFTLIRLPKNLGFGGGNNAGILSALPHQPDYIFLLNQDAYVEKECIGQLIESLEQQQDYGIVSPLQLDSSGEQLDTAFKKYMLASLSEEEILTIIKERTCKVVPARFINAAAWMMPAKALRTTGLFHPAFIHYGEDNHYCSRMQYHGYKTGIDCQAAVIHDRGNDNKDPKQHLIQQLRTVPLYTLLDIRKNFFLAWILGYQKLKRIKKKLGKSNSQEIKALYKEQEKWFRKNLDQAKQIRDETKKDAGI
ncbi:MAG: glycosyltransferase family 2 protein, partial [Chitinophagaceae bacterium]